MTLIMAIANISHVFSSDFWIRSVCHGIPESVHYFPLVAVVCRRLRFEDMSQSPV